MTFLFAFFLLGLLQNRTHQGPNNGTESDRFDASLIAIVLRSTGAAATACIFSEAGAVATDTYGQCFDLNRAGSTLMGHRGILFATDETLAQRIRVKCCSV